MFHKVTNWVILKIKRFIEKAMEYFKGGGITIIDLAREVVKFQKFFVDHFDKLLLHDISDPFIQTAKAKLQKTKPETEILVLCCNYINLEELSTYFSDYFDFLF